MKLLFKGNQSAERLKLLICGTSIRSESLVDALHDHLVDGQSLTLAATFNGVTTGNLSRAVSKLNEVALWVEKVKEFDLKRGDIDAQ